MSTIGYMFNKTGAGWAAGFHTSTNKEVPLYDDMHNSHIWHNLTNIASWIPGLNIIASIYYFVKASQVEDTIKKGKGDVDPHDLQNYATALRMRGIASLCQATVLLFVLDLVATAGRFAPCCQGYREGRL